MKKYSHDEFEFKSKLSADELINRLSTRTLKKDYLITVVTNKDFIGKVERNTFRIIESSRSFPHGSLCVIEGAVTSTSTVHITTSMHTAFRVMFLAWFIILTILFVVTSSPELNGLLQFIVAMPIVGLLFRFYLHHVYVLARIQAVGKLKTIFELHVDKY